MISFNPGPSQLSNSLKDQLQHLAMGNFLSISHRSQEFTTFFHEFLLQFRSVFKVPKTYHIFFVPSATAAMSIVIGNLSNRKTAHSVHGAFSDRFAQTAMEMGRKVQRLESRPDQPLAWRDWKLDSDIEILATTHNETSTGLMWPLPELEDLRKTYPEVLLAVDVTSSFGAVDFDLSQADVWFGSVQKVLGLPAGLGFMVVSPKAMSCAKNIKDKNLPGWMDFHTLQSYYQKNQTFETPSTLHLALLSEQLKDWDVEDIQKRTMKKAERIYSILQQDPIHWIPFIKEPHWRSITVACFDVENPDVWHEFAGRNGFVFGQGYGTLKSSQIRMANFPALTAVDFQMLFQTLRAWNPGIRCKKGGPAS